MTRKEKKTTDQEQTQAAAAAPEREPARQEQEREEKSSQSELEALRAELAAKQKEAQELYDRLLRTQADKENFQKRIKKEQAEFMRFATEGLVNDLLPVLDDLERAIDSAEKNRDFDAFAGGVKLILEQFKKVLEKVGLRDVKAKGRPFDPAHHEAVHMVETDEHEENCVVEELRKGYLLNERVLRPAMVAVAKKKTT